MFKTRGRQKLYKAILDLHKLASERCNFNEQGIDFFLAVSQARFALATYCLDTKGKINLY